MNRKTIVVLLIAVGAGGAVVEADQPPAEREADKAARVAEILESREFHMKAEFSGPPEQQAFCAGFFEALRAASPEIEYPEPVARTDDPGDPVFDKYRYCESDEHQEKNKGGEEFGFFLNMKGQIGTKGFRLYRLDIDGDPSSSVEEVIHGEDPQWQRIAPYSGYYTIVIDRAQGCVFRRVMPMTVFKKASGEISENINALVRYRDRYLKYELANLTVSKNENSEYLLQINSFSAGVSELDRAAEKATYCVWETLVTE